LILKILCNKNDELTITEDVNADEQVSNLTKRVWNLETNVSEISSIVLMLWLLKSLLRKTGLETISLLK